MLNEEIVCPASARCAVSKGKTLRKTNKMVESFIIKGRFTEVGLQVLSKNQLDNALTVAHEALIHGIFSIRFGKKIADGVSGNSLLKEFNKGYTIGDHQLGAYSLGKCTLMNEFISTYRNGLKTNKDKERFDLLVEDDKEVSGIYMDEDKEFQEKVKKGELDEKDF